MCCGGYGYAFSTFYASFALNNKTTITACTIPFVEAKSDEEFYWNLALQMLIFYHAFFIYLGIETTMNLFENFATLSPKLIQLELTDYLTAYEQKKLSEAEMLISFKNISIEIVDYQR